MESAAREVEAIHGKRFEDEPWLQKYFEERYWYFPSDKYDAKKLIRDRAQESRDIDRRAEETAQRCTAPGRYGVLRKQGHNRADVARV